MRYNRGSIARVNGAGSLQIAAFDFEITLLFFSIRCQEYIYVGPELKHG